MCEQSARRTSSGHCRESQPPLGEGTEAEEEGRRGNQDDLTRSLHIMIREFEFGPFQRKFTPTLDKVQAAVNMSWVGGPSVLDRHADAGSSSSGSSASDKETHFLCTEQLHNLPP